MLNRLMSYNEVESKPNAVLNRDLVRRKLPKFKRYDDMLIIQEEAWEKFKKSMPLPVTKVNENNKTTTLFTVEEDELAFLVCQTVQKHHCRRLAVDKGVDNDNYRTPNIEVVLGDNGIVSRKENQLIFEFDITKCMYSFGSVNERVRMGQLDCSNEVVVDLFAGIGYFTLPLLVHGSAALVYACEWNEEAIKALKKNLKLNQVDPCRCTIVEGDNRINRPAGVAHRVILGYLPTSYDWLTTAYECIDKKQGAILHCHDLVECKPASNSSSSPLKDIESSSKSFKPSPSRATKPAHTNESEIDSRRSTGDESNIINNSINGGSSNNGNNIDNVSTNSSLSNTSNCNIVNKSLDDDKQSMDSPPVLLEYPSDDNISNQGDSTTFLTSSYPPLALRDDNSMCEPEIHVSDHEREIHNSRAQQFVLRLQDEIDKDRLDLRARLKDIHVIKFYTPHKYHVVFDISIKRPIGSPLSEFGGNSSSNPNDTSYESCSLEVTTDNDND